MNLLSRLLNSLSTKDEMPKYEPGDYILAKHHAKWQELGIRMPEELKREMGVEE